MHLTGKLCLGDCSINENANDEYSRTLMKTFGLPSHTLIYDGNLI